MWLIRAALRRPVTILIVIVGVALMSLLAVQRMKIDIFPDLGTPVIYVAQPYGGMDPAQMEGYIANYYEYHFLYVTGIEHVESRSIQGATLLKLFFHEGTNMSQAVAETVAQVNRSRAFMPPGTVPPFVVRFDGGSVPVGYLVFSSETRSLGEIQDLALNRIRPMFGTLPGVSAPPPFGGNQRTVVVRVDPDRLRAYRMSRRGDRSRPFQRERRHAVRQRAHRRFHRDGARELRRAQRAGAPGHSRPCWRRTECVPARCRLRGGQLGHSHQLRPDRRQAQRLHSGHQACRCVHAQRGAARDRGVASNARGDSERHQRRARVSTSRDTSPVRSGHSRRKAHWARSSPG